MVRVSVGKTQLQGIYIFKYILVELISFSLILYLRGQIGKERNIPMEGRLRI